MRFRKVTLGAFAILTLTSAADALSSTGETLTWDGEGIDNLIYSPQNWNPDGRPVDGKSGVVAADIKTGYSIGKAAMTNGYNITYKDTSSLGVVNGSVMLTLAGGTEFTFQDNSALQVGEHLYLGFSAKTQGGAKLTLAGNATATIMGNLVFGITGAEGSSSGRLNLQGNSSATVAGVMEWHQSVEGPNVTHYISLADSAKLTIKAAKSRNRNGATLVVNFQQTDKKHTPSLALAEDTEFLAENIQFQINGENAKLGDPRFNLQGGTLTLVVKP
jgi:hypothetical protein